MKKLAAVFTIVKDEELYLPIWLKYYSKYFPMEDIYVLDHQSTDGSTTDLPCNVKVVENEKAFDSLWLLHVVTKFQSELFEKYEYVVFAESDEILITLENPENNLHDHIQMMKNIGRNFDVATGFELVHHSILEGSYDTSRPILDQRRHWYRETHYDKTLISRVPIEWGIGFHDTQYRKQEDWLNGKNIIDPNDNLILIHLHRFDYQTYMKRKLRALDYNIADPINPGESFQNRFTNINDIRYYFFSHEHVLTQLPDNFPIVI
jgi:hypothetical protein